MKVISPVLATRSAETAKAPQHRGAFSSTRQSPRHAGDRAFRESSASSAESRNDQTRRPFTAGIGSEIRSTLCCQRRHQEYLPSLQLWNLTTSSVSSRIHVSSGHTRISRVNSFASRVIWCKQAPRAKAVESSGTSHPTSVQLAASVRKFSDEITGHAEAIGAACRRRQSEFGHSWWHKLSR